MNQLRHAAPDRTFDCYADFYQSSAYAEFEQEHRSGGSLGARVFRAHQDPIDLIDAAVPDLVVVKVHNECSNVTLDVGDGEKHFPHLPKDAFTIIPPNTEERFLNPVPHSVSILAINSSLAGELFDQHGASVDELNWGVGTHFWNSEISAAFDRLWGRLDTGVGSDGLIADGLTLQILGMLADQTDLLPVGDANADTRIIRVVDYIEAHLTDSFSVSELAAIACMSAGHFSRCFKATVGEPVWAYVQRRRCERATELLKFSRKPLADIAYQAGFAHQAHMTNSLKERYGATPGAIRRDGK